MEVMRKTHIQPPDSVREKLQSWMEKAQRNFPYNINQATQGEKRNT